VKHLLSTEDLSLTNAIRILDTAEEMAAVRDREVKKLPALRGRTVVNLFFEDSTRTRISFEAAAKRLSADVINEHHNLVIDSRARELGGVRRPGGLVREGVSEHRAIELANNCRGVHGGVRCCDLAGQAKCQRVTAARDAQQDQVLGAFVGFEDFVGDTSKGTVNIGLVEDNPGWNRCACD
jgi:hypothetical protein